MATTNSALRKAHDDILRPFDAEAKWTIITAARGFRIEEHEGLLKEFDGKQLREGDVGDFIEEFQNFDPPGSMLFAPIKLKVQGSQPKCALLQWYAPDAIPKSYFIGQCQTLQKLLPGFTVPIDIRDRDSLSADDILQKVGGAAPQRDTTLPSPPLKGSKPIVFRPAQVVAGGGGFNARARVPQGGNDDNDGWGADAPPVTRSQLEKVESAYKPTKVDLGQMRSQQEPSRFSAPTRDDTSSGDVVKGGYQPIGKVDIAAIRRQAKESGNAADDRPTTVKGAYEPVGKVDIAAIRAKAQGPGGAAPSASNISPARTGGSAQDDDERPKSLAERSAAFHQSERLATLPKPKVVNKFGAGAGTFTGTKAPAPAGFGPKPAAAAPVGIASRTFADEGGKTPAQIWAEKKARQGGASPTPSPGFGTQPASIASQASGDGGWKSGYSGKSWAPVQTTHTGKSAGSDLSAQRTGHQEQDQDAPPSPASGVGAMRDRFKNATPISMGAAVPSRAIPESRTPSPPPTDLASKPNVGGSRGVPMPGLPPRHITAEKDDEDGGQEYTEAGLENRVDHGRIAREQTQRLPPPPAQPRSPSPPTPDEMRSGSPIRVAMPVARGGNGDLEPAEQTSQPPLPSRAIAEALPDPEDISNEPKLEEDEPGRIASQTAAEATEDDDVLPEGVDVGSWAKIIDDYDYEGSDALTLLKEHQYVTNIVEADEYEEEGWFVGRNRLGQMGVFPGTCVEFIRTVTAQAIDEWNPDPKPKNELSFPEDAQITEIQFFSEDWWYGHFNGSTGLFPATYVVFDA